MDTASEHLLVDVHPELARRVRMLSDKCIANGMCIRVTQGLRTWPQQAALYNQGRTAPGNIVTNAKAGDSMHNYGLAVDIVPGLGDSTLGPFVPDWNAMDFRWKQLLMLAKTCDLAEGVEWRAFPDRPHLYPSELAPNPDAHLRYLFTEGGLTAVFAFFDTLLMPATPSSSVST